LDCIIIQQASEDARIDIARQHERQNRMVQNIAVVGSNVPAPAAGTIVTYGVGFPAFTKELHRVVWPPKFRPKLPHCFDNTANPIEFLHLYTVRIQAAGGGERCKANWFLMALKEAARSWLMNLPEESIASWGELCEQFVTNFRETYESPAPKRSPCHVLVPWRDVAQVHPAIQPGVQ
jgi:hypothetical protein